MKDGRNENLFNKKFHLRRQYVYLPSLSKNKRADNKDITKVDIVLLLNEGHTRQGWPISRITQEFQSKDDIVCSVEYKTATAVAKNKSDKRNANNGSWSAKIKMRTTTIGVKNIAISHSLPGQ